jgi:hyperosmotically inducible periplasmic protein
MKNVSFRISLMTLLLAAFSFQLQSCKEKNRDGEIQTAFTNKTNTDPNLAGVSATVTDGTVTLTGTCANEACRTNAEKSVKDIDGVKKVVNNITVAEVVISPDDQLRSGVNTVISKYDNVQASVADGIITLRGQIERDKLQQLMMDLNALRPKRIDNQLIVK